MFNNIFLQNRCIVILSVSPFIAYGIVRHPVIPTPNVYSMYSSLSTAQG